MRARRRPSAIGTGIRSLVALSVLVLATSNSSVEPGRLAFARGPQTRSVRLTLTQEVNPNPETATQTDRALLPLPKALLGHWMTDLTRGHLYFSVGKFISVMGGNVHEGAYVIDEVDEEQSTIRIRITQTHTRTLTFSSDKKKVSDIVEVARTKADKPVNWRFVGSEQTPSRDVIKSSKKEDVILAVITQPPPQPTFIIGDVRTKIYYWPGCPEYSQVPMKKRMYFKSRKAAGGAGYHPAKGCP